MAQISFSFSGGFWPISFPLFHGTARSLALETVLVSAYMNGSFLVERSPILNVDQGRLSTRCRRSAFSEADSRRAELLPAHANIYGARKQPHKSKCEQRSSETRPPE